MAAGWRGFGSKMAALAAGGRFSLRGKPAAVTGRRVGARAQPSQAGRQRPTQTPSNITRLSTITDTHLHSFHLADPSPTHLTPWALWASSRNGFCGKSGGRGGRNKLARAVTVCSSTLLCTINCATVHPPLYNAHLYTADCYPHTLNCCIPTLS